MKPITTHLHARRSGTRAPSQADLHAMTEGMLRDIAFVLHATDSLKATISKKKTCVNAAAR